MIINSKMKLLLANLDVNSINPSIDYLITEHKNKFYEPYWFVNNSCGQSFVQILKSGEDLTDLEWDENEIYINLSYNINDLLKEAVSVYNSLKLQIINACNDSHFDIVISVDKGSKGVSPSATVRLYAIRNNYHIIQPNTEDVEEFCQPVMIDMI